MNITLIGMPGVGKSLIGGGLARRLNYTFIDVDEIIQRKHKLTLQQIIDRFGEQPFLKIEERVILKLGEFENCIISPGGSVVYSAKAINFLKTNSTLVFLEAPFEYIESRITNLSTRGIVGLKEKGLESLFYERGYLYRKYADITIGIHQDVNINIMMDTIIHKIFGRRN